MTAQSRRRWPAANQCNRGDSSCRILDSGFGEASRSNQAAVAMAAWSPVLAGVVTAVRQAEVHAEFSPEPDDAGLGEVLQRREKPQRAAFHASLRRQARQIFERRDELRPAIRVPGVV